MEASNVVRTGFTFKVTLAIKPLEREAETETLRKRVESEQTKRIHDNLENERRRGPKPEWGGGRQDTGQELCLEGLKLSQ